MSGRGLSTQSPAVGGASIGPSMQGVAWEGCGLGQGAGPAGSGRGQSRWRAPGWPRPVEAHPLVDGVCLAQRALGGRDAVGDAPVALAQTPQLAADLLRAKVPAQARTLPPTFLGRTQATRSVGLQPSFPAFLFATTSRV